MLAAAFLGLSDGHRAADRLASRTLPAAVALRDLSVASKQAQDNFLTAVNTTDADKRTVALAAAMDAGRAQDDAWRTYRDVAVTSPDESALRRTFQATLDRARELGAAVASRPADDPARAALLDEERAEVVIQMNALYALESDIYLPAAQKDALAAAAGFDTGRLAVAFSYGIAAGLFSIAGIVLLRGARRDHQLRSAETVAMRLAAETASFERSLQAGPRDGPNRGGRL